MPYGKIQVHEDPHFGVWKVHYSADLLHLISNESLVHTKQGALAHIAKDMVKSMEKDIFEHLLTCFDQMTKQSQATLPKWNDPDVNPSAYVLATAETIKAGTIKVPQQQAYGVLEALQKVIPGLKDARASCPASKDCGDGPYKYTLVSTLIQHLNDYHRWTREKIADWLDTLDCDLSFQEPAEPSAPPIKDAYEALEDKFPSHKLDAMKYALLTTPVLDPETAKKILGTNPT